MAYMDEQIGRPRIQRQWLVIFADLVSLLLTFFVMMFAMSTVEQAKWEAAANSLSRSMNIDSLAIIRSAQPELTVPTVDRPDAVNLDYLVSVLRGQFAETAILNRSVIRRHADHLIISFPNDLLFGAGSAELSARAETALAALGGVLGNLSNKIDVSGHTDPSPISSRAYPSNWELSLARARAIAAHLSRSGYQRDIGVFGYGDTRFGDLSPKLAADQREALARRVDVIIRPSKAGRK
jgi:chemotaxis protein MotB